MKPVLPAAHVYRDEVLPIVGIGTVINLIGSFLLNNLAALGSGSAPGLLSPSLIFLDTAGTAFVAIILGPWWAATVGVLSSTLNTFWVADIFAYAVVNVALGLGWGYVARLLNVEFYLMPNSPPPPVRQAAISILLLIATGVVVSTVFSAAVKITLLERAGGDLFQGKFSAYYHGLENLAERLGLPNPRNAALFTFDLYRNLIDKSIATLIGLTLAFMIGANRTYSSGVTRPRSIPMVERLRTGGDSILVFAIVYAIYLLLSRTVLLEVSFTHAPENSTFENWMKLLGALLFAPFIVSYVAFVFFTYNSSRSMDMAIHNERAHRQSIYERFRRRERWTRERVDQLQIQKLLHENSVYGMLITTAFWPAKQTLPGPLSVWAYVIVMILTSSAYFMEQRERLLYFVQARLWYRSLDNWAAGKQTGTGEIIDIFLKSVAPYLVASLSGIQQVRSLSALVAINLGHGGWLNQLRQLRGVDHLLVAAPDRPLAKGRALSDLLKVINAAPTTTAVVLAQSVTADATEQMAKSARELGHTVIVLELDDLKKLIELKAKGADPGAILARAQIESRLQIKLD